MLYKCIAAIRVLNYLFDIDEEKAYRIVSHDYISECGYFLIEYIPSCKHWIVLKSIDKSFFVEVEEEIRAATVTSLPYFKKSAFILFLYQYCKSNKHFQYFYNLAKLN